MSKAILRTDFGNRIYEDVLRRRKDCFEINRVDCPLSQSQRIDLVDSTKRYFGDLAERVQNYAIPATDKRVLRTKIDDSLNLIKMQFY